MLSDWVVYGYRRGIRYSNHERLGAASDLTHIKEEIEAIQDLPGFDELSPNYMELNRRFMSLQNIALGADKDIFLPPTRPYLVGVYPYQIRQDYINKDRRITLLGHFFESPYGKVNSAFVGGFAPWKT